MNRKKFVQLACIQMIRPQHSAECQVAEAEAVIASAETLADMLGLTGEDPADDLARVAAGRSRQRKRAEEAEAAREHAKREHGPAHSAASA